MKQPMSKAKSLTYVIIALAICVFLLGIGFVWILKVFGLDEITAGFMASQIGILAFALVLFEFKYKELFKTFNFKITLKSIAIVGICVSLVIAINIAVGTTMNILDLNDVKIQEYTKNTTKAMIENGNIMTLFILPIIAAPIFEEFAFRAGFKRILVDESNWKPSHFVIISSILFGLLHWQPGTFSFIPIIVTGAIGVVLAIVYLKTENLLLSIFIHMLYNLIIMSVAFVTT